jgi:transposase
MVLMLEIGRVDRFPTAAHLASYAGLVPRVHSSGGHTRMGQVCGNVNRTLKWAFVETSNLIVINQRRLAFSDTICIRCISKTAAIGTRAPRSKKATSIYLLS